MLNPERQLVLCQVIAAPQYGDPPSSTKRRNSSSTRAKISKDKARPLRKVCTILRLLIIGVGFALDSRLPSGIGSSLRGPE